MTSQIRPSNIEPRLSPAAQKVMDDLIVKRGLSYAEAHSEALDQAFRVAAPYKQVAAVLERELARLYREGHRV